MDALIKICEEELRRRRQQNPRLKGFELRPVMFSEWVNTFTSASNAGYEVFAKQNEIIIATYAMLNAVPVGGAPSFNLANARLTLTRKPEKSGLSFGVLSLQILAGNSANIFEMSSIGFDVQTFQTNLRENWYIQAFRVSFYTS